MNKIGIAALATAVISASAAAKDTSTIEVNLGSNFKGYLGSNLTLDQLTGARAKNTSLYQTNWSGFTVGSVIGQDLWTNYGGTSTDFNINASRTGFPAGTQSLRMSGSSTSRFLYRDLTTEWNNRAAGENIINAEFSIYRGAASTIRSRAGNTTYMYQGDGSTSGSVFFGAMGWRMDMGTGGTGSTAYAQGKLAAVGYFTSAAALANFGVTTAGTYSFTFGTSVPNVAQSTWVNFFTSRNLTTGELIVAYSTNGGASFTGFTLNAGIVTTPNPTILSVETDYITTGAGSGTNTSQFGDLAVYTTPAPGAAALLGLAGLVSRRRR